MAEEKETKEEKKAEEKKEEIKETTQYIYKKVDSLVFGVASPQMLKKMASAKIVTPELYERKGIQ